MGWRDLAGPCKRYAGSTSGTVVVPKGASIVYLEFSGGTVSGFPDEQGGTITITSPTSAAFIYAPYHAQGFDGGATITFSSTVQWFLELYAADASVQLP